MTTRMMMSYFVLAILVCFAASLKETEGTCSFVEFQQGIESLISKRAKDLATNDCPEINAAYICLHEIIDGDCDSAVKDAAKAARDTYGSHVKEMCRSEDYLQDTNNKCKLEDFLKGVESLTLKRVEYLTKDDCLKINKTHRCIRDIIIENCDGSLKADAAAARDRYGSAVIDKCKSGASLKETEGTCSFVEFQQGIESLISKRAKDLATNDCPEINAAYICLHEIIDGDCDSAVKDAAKAARDTYGSHVKKMCRSEDYLQDTNNKCKLKDFLKGVESLTLKRVEYLTKDDCLKINKTHRCIRDIIIENCDGSLKADAAAARDRYGSAVIDKCKSGVFFFKIDAKCRIEECEKDLQSLKSKKIDDLTKYDCIQIKEVSKCIRDDIIENCKESTKNDVKTAMNTYGNNFIEKCNKEDTLKKIDAKCKTEECLKDVQSLISKRNQDMTEYECTKIQTAARCSRDEVIDNNDCDKSAKDAAEVEIKKLTEITDTCKSEGDVLVSSKVICLVMCCVVYFQTSFK